MPDIWTFKITGHAGSFVGLKAMVADAARVVAASNSFKDVQSLGMGGGGNGGVGAGYYITVSCPVEEHIRQLRKEADELEASLRGEGHVIVATGSGVTDDTGLYGGGGGGGLEFHYAPSP